LEKIGVRYLNNKMYCLKLIHILDFDKIDIIEKPGLINNLLNALSQDFLIVSKGSYVHINSIQEIELARNKAIYLDEDDKLSYDIF
jgi:hypothetical protein